MTFPAELKTKLIQILTKNKIYFSQGWDNFMETVKNPAALVIEVESAQQLQTVIKSIKSLNSDRTPDNKITVRATAGWTDKADSCCCFWKNVQESDYNEGFSFSQVVGGKASPDSPGTDVIVRFGKKFHSKQVIGPIKKPVIFNPDNPIHKLPSFEVEVSAGVQVAELAEFLRTNKLSLPTVSMISWVTPVGLAGTAGHGTGRDEPAFSGLIESFKVCDMDGEIREIKRGQADFDTLAGGHSGLLGIVLSIKLRTVQAFNLRETVELFPNAKAMTGKLSDILKGNQYVSIMGMPSYVSEETEESVSKWQIRKWNYTKEEPPKGEKAPYAPDTTSFSQQVEIGVGAPVMEYLIDSGLSHLLPYYMLTSAAAVTGARGTKPKVGFENHITHPQVAFPKKMRDVSYLIPVKDDDSGKTLETILQNFDAILEDAGKKGEYPVTYAIYVRYLKGTNGGLSTSFTSSDDERVLTIDVVTHPDAPGITNFEQNVLSLFKEMGVTPRNHLGKNFPAGVLRYDQFLGGKAVEEFTDALKRWNKTPGKDDGGDRFEMSPFYTSYMKSMLSPSPKLELVKELSAEKEGSSEIELSSAPIELSSAPIELSSAPIELSSAPIELSSAPVKFSGAIVELSLAPVKLSVAPIELSSAPVKLSSAPIKQASKKYSDEECHKFLTRLHEHMTLIPVHDEVGKKAKDAFLKACKSELDSRSTLVTGMSLT
jgi:hypothetical protein